MSFGCWSDCGCLLAFTALVVEGSGSELEITVQERAAELIPTRPPDKVGAEMVLVLVLAEVIKLRRKVIYGVTVGRNALDTGAIAPAKVSRVLLRCSFCWPRRVFHNNVFAVRSNNVTPGAL